MCTNPNACVVFVETVKDLIRFLKREDESCDIRRQLGHAQILQNDLIPILKTYKDDRILWETVIRLDISELFVFYFRTCNYVNQSVI